MRESAQRGVEACLSAVGNGVGKVEPILTAQLAPVGLLLARQHYDDLQVGREVVERLESVHQHGLSANGQKLLGHVAAHAQPLTAGHYDGIVLLHRAKPLDD